MFCSPCVYNAHPVYIINRNNNNAYMNIYFTDGEPSAYIHDMTLELHEIRVFNFSFPDIGGVEALKSGL